MEYNSKELWERLSELAHFDDTAYDEALKNSIASSLGLGTGKIADELECCGVSTTDLLTAVLNAIQPFSQMLTDLLRTYEAAGARSNKYNIEVVFNFDGVPAKFHLDQFRREEIMIQERASLRSYLERPWDLIELLKKYDRRLCASECDRFPQEIQDWFMKYQLNQLPEHLPSFPDTLDSQLKERLKEVRDLAENALHRYSIEYSPQKGLKKSIEDACKKYATKFWFAETDHWLGNFVRYFYNVVDYYNTVSRFHGRFEEKERIDFANAIDDFLTSDAVKVVSEEEKYTAILEILDMPFWKYRYEMYSAWVFTCIVDAVSDLGISYHIENGILSFDFSGSLIASLYLPGVTFDIWAEKRHPAVNPKGKGRKANIQPDYSIIMHPDRKKTICMLIECKQYKKSNNENFANAVNDYTIACPSAKVFLTNYGKISKKLTAWLKPEVIKRSATYGNMQPNELIRMQFCEDIREIIINQWTDYIRKGSKYIYIWEKQPKLIKIKLSWGNSPRDLDLMVIIKGTNDLEISYRNKGQLDNYPYAELDKDVTQGPGTETVTLRRLISGCYDIYVNNYSEEEQIDGVIQLQVSSGNEKIYFSKIGLWDTHDICYVGTINAIGLIVLNNCHLFQIQKHDIP